MFDPLLLKEPVVNGAAKEETPAKINGRVTPEKPKQPIEASVVITAATVNGSAKADDIKADDGALQVSSESEAEDDESEIASSVLEPVTRANLRNSLKALLVDLAPPNEAICSRHSLTLNTRAKLLHSFDKWFLNTDKEKETSRLMAVVGKPGIGKTCLASEICRRHPQQLAGSHFFQQVNASLDLNDPRCTIMGLARVFCDVFPNYAYMLPKLEKMEDLVLNADIADLYEELLQTPLGSAGFVHDPEKHMLIVIDALDECSLTDREQFLQVLNNSTESLPEWLYILVTVRNENQILGLLDTAQVLELKNNNDNLMDIKRYLREPMGRYMDRISLDGGLTQLAKKSEGSFLAAYLLRQKLDTLPQDTKIALRSIDATFVSGFNALCKEFFQGYRESLGNKSTPKEAINTYNTILGILVAAKEPLHKEFLQYCSFEDDTVLAGLTGVLVEEEACMSLCHSHLIDWLCNESLSGELSASPATGREKLAELCATWVSTLTDDKKGATVHPKLMEYALKHMVWHLTDVPKQQENLTKFLCCINYIQQKLSLPGVHLSHLIGDYRHAHFQINGDSSKLITLPEYMKRQPKLMEQIDSFYKFVNQRGVDLNQNPQFTLHIAANYPTVQRIQQNARVELSRQPWIEDLTAVPESHGVSSNYSGQIIAFDLSHDTKTLGLVTKDAEYNLKLHLLNPHTGDRKSETVDIKGIKDRVGLTMKFLPDGNIFVGSLTTFVSFRGKPLPSGLDMQSIQMKEKFSIECCAVSGKYLACGLNTFPWNGRSLHLTVFDLKAKKCSKTLEVLRFRFGGSAQFGVKCCAVSRDETMVAACVKQSNKPQLKVNVWGIPKWAVLHSVDIDCDSITKCSFVDSSTLLLGSSVRSMTGTAGYAFTPIKTHLWDLNASSKPVEVDSAEAHSVYVANPKRTASAKWSTTTSGPSTVCVWSKSQVNTGCDVSYTIRGLKAASDMRIAGDYVMFVGNDELRIYNVHDLESPDSKASADDKASTMGISVTNIGIFSRSDDVIITHSTPSDVSQECVSVSVLDPRQEDLTLVSTPFQNETRQAYKSSDSIGQFKCFRGNGSTLEVCCSTGDGNFLVFNAGSKVKVWNRSQDQVFTLPTYDEQSDKNNEYKKYGGINCAISGKDATVGIVFGQLPYNIYLYDLKSKKMTQKISLHRDGKPSIVSDFSFLPSNGFVLSYHREFKHGLAVWNQRNGSEISRVHSANICYAKASPASDRFVLSLTKNKQEGEIILRSSDNKVSSSLATPSTWLPNSEHSDLEFSVDGTVLVGVSRETGICRVWNAGNGEVLKDLNTSFTNRVEIVGMLTNTHVVFQDERLVVFDVGSGDCVSVLPLEDGLMRKLSRSGLRITSRGNYMVGAKANGHLCVFECHHFQPIKRKTTLQRMKSFTK